MKMAFGFDCVGVMMRLIKSVSALQSKTITYYSSDEVGPSARKAEAGYRQDAGLTGKPEFVVERALIRPS